MAPPQSNQPDRPPQEPIVLQLIHNLRLEGAQRVLVNLALDLPDAGWRPVVHAWRRGGPFTDILADAGVRMIPPEGRTGRAGGVTGAVARLMRLCRAEGVSVIHAHQADSAIVGAAVAARTGLPLVITHHSTRLLPSSYTPWQRWTAGFLYRLAARRAAVNVAVSSDVADSVTADLGLPADRVTVVPNGVPVGLRPQSWTPSAAPRLLMVGRLNAIKNPREMVAALPGLRTRFPGLTLRLVGEGPEAGAIMDKARALGVADAVELPGLVSDVVAELRAADLVVSTSLHEGAPMGLLEAMGQGVPVVASDVPGTRSVVMRGHSGRLYRRGDVDDLTATVSMALEQPAATLALAQGAWDDVTAGFSRTAMARAHARLYALAGLPTVAGALREVGRSKVS